MHRVTEPGGIVATRETDISSWVWWPEIEGMEGWRDGYGYIKVARANGGEPDAGRRLHVWAKMAGLAAESLTLSTSTWLYSKAPEERTWWSEIWAKRTLSSNCASTAIRNGIYTQEGSERIAAIWRQWGADEDAWNSIMHGEVIARV